MFGPHLQMCFWLQRSSCICWWRSKLSAPGEQWSSWFGPFVGGAFADGVEEIWKVLTFHDPPRVAETRRCQGKGGRGLINSQWSVHSSRWCYITKLLQILRKSRTDSSSAWKTWTKVGNCTWELKGLTSICRTRTIQRPDGSNFRLSELRSQQWKLKVLQILQKEAARAELTAAQPEGVRLRV